MSNPLMDMHIHTTFSDGRSSPADIVKTADRLGYYMIAITDHDNIDGVAEALEEGKGRNLTVVPGMEIAVNAPGNIGIHMLGYGFDISDEVLTKFLQKLADARKTRNLQLFKALNSMGYDISPGEIEKEKNGFVGKPLIARLLIKKGYIKHEEEAFEKIFTSDECMAVKKYKPSSQETINIIKNAGGRPVMAHPIQTKGLDEPGSLKFYKNIRKLLSKLKEQGLEGLECFHPDQNESQSAEFIKMADEFGLLITRGSDFHGDDFAKAGKTADYINLDRIILRREDLMPEVPKHSETIR